MKVLILFSIFIFINVVNFTFGDSSTVQNYALLNITLKAGQLTKTIILFESCLYGVNSPRAPVYGKVVLINSTDSIFGCKNYLNKKLPTSYIALVSRGGCPFEQKVINAFNNNASAIIISSNNNGVFNMLTNSKKSKSINILFNR